MCYINLYKIFFNIFLILKELVIITCKIKMVTNFKILMVSEFVKAILDE